MTSMCFCGHWRSFLDERRRHWRPAAIATKTSSSSSLAIRTLTSTAAPGRKKTKDEDDKGFDIAAGPAKTLAVTFFQKCQFWYRSIWSSSPPPPEIGKRTFRSWLAKRLLKQLPNDQLHSSHPFIFCEINANLCFSKCRRVTVFCRRKLLNKINLFFHSFSTSLQPRQLLPFSLTLCVYAKFLGKRAAVAAAQFAFSLSWNAADCHRRRRTAGEILPRMDTGTILFLAP